MACEDYTSNNIPLGVGYDANGDAKSFVELSAINVTTVSATTYIGAAVEGTFSSLTDVCYSPTATVEGQILIWNATGACWAASTPVVGGGAALPTGAVGEILAYPVDAWVAQSTVELAADPFGLATTAALAITNSNLAATGAALAITNTNLAATAAYVVNTFATTGTEQAITATKTFTVDQKFRNAYANGFAYTDSASALQSVTGTFASVPAFGIGSIPSAIPSTTSMMTFLSTSGNVSDCTDVSSYPARSVGELYCIQAVANAGDGPSFIWKWVPLKDGFTAGTNQTWPTAGATYGGAEQIDFGKFYGVADGTGKGDLSTGFIFVSGTSSTATTTKYASTFGQNWVSGGPLLAESDNFIYLSGNSGENVAGLSLASNAKSFMNTGLIPNYALSAVVDDKFALTATLNNYAVSTVVNDKFALTATLPDYTTTAVFGSYSATIAEKTPYVLYTSGGDPAIQVGESSTGYHDLFTFTIPGNALGTHGSVHVEWGGDVLHPAGLTGNTGVKILLNATNVISNSSNQIAADDDPYPLKGSLVIGMKGDVAKQRVTHWIEAGAAGGSTGQGGWLYGKNSGTMAGDGTEDSRNDLTVTFQIKFTVSDASHFFRLYHVRATVYPDIN